MRQRSDNTFALKDGEHTNRQRRLHDKKLNDLYSLDSTIWVIRSRKMRWAGYVASMGGGQVHTVFRWGNLKERDHLEDLGMDGKIILNCILRNGVEGCGLDSSGSGQWKVDASCKHSIKSSGSITCMEFSHCLKIYSLLKDSDLQH
jgi:hypothetical protein